MPLLIAIAGGSGSGKTYLAHRLREVAGGAQVAVLSMDQYFMSLSAEEAALDPRDINFDHPAHIDLRQLLADLQALKAGRRIRAPRYDFRTQVQTPEAVAIEPAPVIIVEGLFVLAPPLVELFDLAIFLEVDPDQRLIGRLLRDMKQREPDPLWTIDRYQRFVRPSYEAFVAPTKFHADIVVDFTHRRAFFQELLCHLVIDSLHNGLDLPKFLAGVRAKRYHLGVRKGKEVARPALNLLDLVADLAAEVPPAAAPSVPGRRPHVHGADDLGLEPPTHED